MGSIRLNIYIYIYIYSYPMFKHGYWGVIMNGGGGGGGGGGCSSCGGALLGLLWFCCSHCGAGGCAIIPCSLSLICNNKLPEYV